MFGFLKKNGLKSINVNELDSLIGNIELIDVREPYEFKGGSILTAKNIPMNTLLATPGKYLDQRKTYYIMCQSGSRSRRTAGELRRKGFEVVNISGGIASYTGKKRK